jgi:hypothetical protein
MNTVLYKRLFRSFCVLILAGSVSGCMDWIRAYQTYLQISEFDNYFSVTSAENFTLHFKEPILYSKDFVSLSKLYPSEDVLLPKGRLWRYWFRKIDSSDSLIVPEIKFYSELSFNSDKRITNWSFSSLFLQIAPAKFLEASLRSIGAAEIEIDSKKLRFNNDLLEKTSDDLPKKTIVLERLGEPLQIIDDGNFEIYIYHFRLESYHIEDGYEDRALTEIKVFFDKENQKLVRMSGRFAGLKVSINYQALKKPETKHFRLRLF